MTEWSLWQEERKSRKKGSTCGKTTKSTPTKGAGAPCKGKGIGRRKKVEKGRERRGSIHGQAMRSAVRMEKEFSRRVKKEGRGALWKRYSRRGIIIRIWMVYKENDSNICSMWKI